MNATWSLVLSILSNALGTLLGDPVHSKLGSAVQKVLQVTSAVVEGAEIDPAPVHAVLQEISSAGRAPNAEDWQKLHDVAHAALTGEAAQNAAPPPPAS